MLIVQYEYTRRSLPQVDVVEELQRALSEVARYDPGLVHPANLQRLLPLLAPLRPLAPVANSLVSLVIPVLVPLRPPGGVLPAVDPAVMVGPPPPLRRLLFSVT